MQPCLGSSARGFHRCDLFQIAIVRGGSNHRRRKLDKDGETKARWTYDPNDGNNQAMTIVYSNVGPSVDRNLLSAANGVGHVPAGFRG